MSEIDDALTAFGGAVARFKAIAHGTRRPARSRWRKWRLCWERARQRRDEAGEALPIYVQAGKDAWTKYSALRSLGYTTAEAEAHGEVVFRDLVFEQWRTRYLSRTQAADRYRRMLWGRKPFGGRGR